VRALAICRDVLLGAFAPARCAGCDELSRDAVCGRCRRALEALRTPQTVRRDGTRWIAAFEYLTPVREIIHHAKYRAGRSALELVAGAASLRLVRCAQPRGDGVVPVPLGRRRLRQRGYNQAEQVAAALAQACAMDVLGGLVRIRETRPQAGADAEARRRNVSGAFEWRGPALRGARLWLVDDVVTTGATAEAAVAALRAAGASRVDVAAVAAVP
jgi:ComF family protein